MAQRPIFSLCHTTRRIPGWEKAAREWIEAADNPQAVEYILCVDGVDADKVTIEGVWRFRTFLVFNEGRRCAVDGWNAAAAASTGQFLITVSDDLKPIPHWDTRLLEVLGDRIDEEAVVWVNSGEQRDLMAFSMLTRKYYERYGYIFYPEYLGMFGDDDFTAQAIKDGVIIDCRKTLPLFEHLHPAHGTAAMDEVYAWQNRPEAYQVGLKIFEQRHGSHPFIKEPMANGAGLASPKRRIAVCLPGSSFPKDFVCAWGQTLGYLIKQGWIVTPIFGHTSLVYVTRQSMSDAALGLPDYHQYVLWMDSDQIVMPGVVARLVNFLDTFPAVDMIAGWTYIQHEETGITTISAGKYTPDNTAVVSIPLAEMDRIAKDGHPIEVEWTGFPVVLMRHETIRKAAASAKARTGVANPFAPIPSTSPWGFTGEDISFCVNVKDAGGRIYVDSGAYVPHLKLRAVMPPPANETPIAARQDEPEVAEDLGSIIGRFYVGQSENRVKRALRRVREYTGV